MKRLVLSELILLFLATTFVTDSPPPGWYQQTLPVNKTINDIFFIDSLKGWVVTAGGSNATDTAFILNTIDGGNNWAIQKTGIEALNAVQFLDVNTGYAAGKLYNSIQNAIYKTTDRGGNWLGLNNIGGGGIEDMQFVNKDTGWVCDDFTLGGLYRTTDGALSWEQQLDGSFRPSRLFFLNNDTGWVVCNTNKLFRTTNSGGNWNLQYTFSAGIANMVFINKDTGFVAGGFGTHSIKRTTNAGFTWDSTNNSQGGKGLFFINKQIGWNSDVFSIVQKTTDGGLNWYRQTVPSGYYYSIQFADTSNGWAGGTILIHSNDGGGPPLGIIKSNITVSGFMLKQNYPNPFNGVTLIFFDLPAESRVDLKLYNILGEEVSELLDDEFFTAGSVQFGFNADKEGLSSGVYFYRLIARPENGKEIFIDTKKMILIK